VYEHSRLGIALTWPESARFHEISAEDYLSLGNSGTDPGYYFEQVGLPPEIYLHRMMDKSLSGGERKRIELASVLAVVFLHGLYNSVSFTNQSWAIYPIFGIVFLGICLGLRAKKELEKYSGLVEAS